MRVHGENKIVRSKDVEPQNDYKKYLRILRKDFKYICGYCGKTEEVTKKGFEIDHFVPKNIAPEREADYENLVYSCFTCNRKKNKKWPTKDKNKIHNGEIGLLDPVNEEFDVHISRKNNGFIEGNTNLGKYVCKEIFKFDVRPIQETWTCGEILKRQKQIEEAIDTSQKEYQEYIELNKRLKELLSFLFEKGE